MKTIEIDEKNKMIGSLLNDSFWADFNLYHMVIHNGFTTEMSGRKDNAKWEVARKVFWQILQSESVPDDFQIALLAGEDMLTNFAGAEHILQDDLSSLSVTIHFQSKTMVVSTSVSFQTFHMDASSDQAWHEIVKAAIKKALA